MIVIDTSVLVAIIREEDDFAKFIDLLDETDTIMSIVSYVETHMVVAGSKLRADPSEVELTVLDLGIDVVEVTRDQTDAVIGAFFKYGKGRHRARLNFADCFAYGLAKSRALPLLFKGDDFSKTDIVPAWRP